MVWWFGGLVVIAMVSHRKLLFVVTTSCGGGFGDDKIAPGRAMVVGLHIFIATFFGIKRRFWFHCIE